MTNNNDFIDYNAETIIKQFVVQCNEINEIYKSHIDPYFYIAQFYQFSSSIRYYAELQEQLYKELKTQLPSMDFGIRGRSKTAFSYFQKVLEKLRKQPFNIASIEDQFANKIFLRSIDYPIDNIDIYCDNSFMLYSGCYELNLIDGDALKLQHSDQLPSYLDTIIIKNPSEQIIIKDNNIFLKDLDTGIICDITGATLKRSNKDTLIPYIYEMRKISADFYTKSGFERCKTKDYIATPKENGYSSLQDSFYCKTNKLYIETQYKTQDMEKASKEDPSQKRNTYKPGSREINKNTLYQVPHYVLTTSFYDDKQQQAIPTSYIPSDDKCLEYTFHITKKEYLEEMVLQENLEFLETKLKNTIAPEERAKLQAQIKILKSQSFNNRHNNKKMHETR